MSRPSFCNHDHHCATSAWAQGATLTLAFSPPIGREQSVDLLLNSDANNYVIPRAPDANRSADGELVCV